MDDVDRAIEMMERMDALNLAARAARGIPGPRISPHTHCLECGDPIPVARREAEPTTRYCAPCAGDMESLAARGLI